MDAVSREGRSHARMCRRTADLNMKVHPKSKFEKLCQLIGLRRWDTSNLKEQAVRSVEKEQRPDLTQTISLGLHAVARAAATFAEIVVRGDRRAS